MMQNDKRQLNNQAGFNIIEILIMISLVTLTFVAIMSLVIKNVQLEFMSKNDYVAIGLVKEGVELVEQIRNDNIKRDPALPFYQDITCHSSDDCSTQPDEDGWTCYYRIDYLDARGSVADFRWLDPVNCHASGETGNVLKVSDPWFVLQFDDSKYYHHDNTLPNSDSNFHRMITTVWRVGSSTGPYLDVKSEVYWNYKGQGYTYTLDSKIFNNNDE